MYRHSVLGYSTSQLTEHYLSSQDMEKMWDINKDIF